MNQGWVRKKLKDCFKLKSGENLTAKQMIAGDYPVFGGNSQAGTHDQYNLSGDNVIVGRVGALCGNARHITDEIWLTDNAFKIVNKKFHFENDFLTYLLNYKNLRSLARQAAQPVISNSSLGELVLEFPEDSAEQRRIVAILDQAFADIEQARAKTEQNLKNTRELFESYLQQVFTQGGENWSDSILGNISERVSVGHVGSTSKYYCDASDGVPFLRSQNVRPYNIDMKNIQYITHSFHESLKKSKLQLGDLLFVRVGANRGDCCALRFIETEINCANIIFARPRNHSIDYLELFCNSAVGQKSLLSMTTGSAQGVINTKSVAQLKIPLPPFDEQQDIVKQVSEFKKRTENLESVYKLKLQRLDELKKSILQKAFSGELTKDSKGVAA